MNICKINSIFEQMQEIEEKNVLYSNESIGKRLSEVRKISEPRLSQADFSKKYKIEPRTKLSKIEQGKQSVSPEILITYFENFDTNINWVLTGKGKRFLTKSEHTMVNDPEVNYENEHFKKQINELKQQLEKLKDLADMKAEIKKMKNDITNLQNEKT